MDSAEVGIIRRVFPSLDSTTRAPGTGLGTDTAVLATARSEPSLRLTMRSPQIALIDREATRTWVCLVARSTIERPPVARGADTTRSAVSRVAFEGASPKAAIT